MVSSGMDAAISKSDIGVAIEMGQSGILFDQWWHTRYHER